MQIQSLSIFLRRLMINKSYEKKQKEDKENDTAYIFANEKERYDAQIRLLRAQAEPREQELNDMMKIVEKNDVIVNNAKSEVEGLEKLNQELEETVKKIEETISSKKLEEGMVDKTNLQVEKVEKLRKDQIQVKEQVKSEKDKLDTELNKITTTLSQMSGKEGNEVIQQINENYEEEYKKLLEKKAEIAEKNKVISKLQRKIEQCPSKTELTQYIGRFTELYEQVNRRNEEYKKYINLYNTLLTTHDQLKDRLDRALDAKDGYLLSKSKKDKEKYLKTLTEIVQELNNNVKKAQEVCGKAKAEKDELQVKLDDWIIKERNYFRMLSDFHKECMKNQELRDQVELIQPTSGPEAPQ